MMWAEEDRRRAVAGLQMEFPNHQISPDLTVLGVMETRAQLRSAQSHGALGSDSPFNKKPSFELGKKSDPLSPFNKKKTPFGDPFP